MRKLFDKILKIGNRDGRIYMDYSASTPVDPRVMNAMEKYWNVNFGNAGSLHKEGRMSKEALENSRKVFSDAFNVHTDEIIFTASGTESNNLAIFGTINSLEKKGHNLNDLHIITSSVEHPSVLDCFKNLEGRGVRVTYLSVDEEGFVKLEDLKNSLRDETVLISIMFVNNEIGTIEPIKEISKIIRDFKNSKKENKSFPYFHTDGSQAWLLPAFDVRKLDIDLMTLDAQKIYGPKGVGALYKKREVELAPVLIGGKQEYILRPGTENIPLIVGFAKAFELVRDDQEKEAKRLSDLRDYFILKLGDEIKNIEFNGPIGKHIDKRIANNINFSIPGINNEFFAISLDEKGVAIGTRSACIVNGGTGSYVIGALGKSDEISKSSLRFTIGKFTTKENIDRAVRAIKEIVENNSK